MNEQGRYRAYLLRFWRVDSGGQPVWRAALEDPHSGERRGFSDVEQMFAFLEEQLGARQTLSAPPTCSPDASSQRNPEGH